MSLSLPGSVLLLLLAACGGSATEPSEPAAPASAEPVAPEPAAPAEPAAPVEDPATRLVALDRAESEARAAALPVLEKHCARCHSKAGKKARKKTLEHLAIDGYPFTGHHAGAEMTKELREVLGIGGGKATMPFDKPGSVAGDELATVATWLDALDARAAVAPPTGG